MTERRLKMENRRAALLQVDLSESPALQAEWMELIRQRSHLVGSMDVWGRSTKSNRESISPDVGFDPMDEIYGLKSCLPVPRLKADHVVVYALLIYHFVYFLAMPCLLHIAFVVVEWGDSAWEPAMSDAMAYVDSGSFSTTALANADEDPIESGSTTGVERVPALVLHIPPAFKVCADQESCSEQREKASLDEVRTISSHAISMPIQEPTEVLRLQQANLVPYVECEAETWLRIASRASMTGAVGEVGWPSHQKSIVAGGASKPESEVQCVYSWQIDGSEAQMEANSRYEMLSNMDLSQSPELLLEYTALVTHRVKIRSGNGAVGELDPVSVDL